MKQSKLLKLSLIFIATAMISCGGSSESGETQKMMEKPKSMLSSEPKSLEEAEKDWQNNKGVGEVKDLELPDEIDQALADKGEEVYEAKCTACHKPDKDFIGPAQRGVLKRRTPEWVMNMILNPELMIKEDPIAKQLLVKYNGSPMANQNLTWDEARAVLEYFRTLN